MHDLRLNYVLDAGLDYAMSVVTADTLILVAEIRQHILFKPHWNSQICACLLQWQIHRLDNLSIPQSTHTHSTHSTHTISTPTYCSDSSPPAMGQ